MGALSPAKNRETNQSLEWAPVACKCIRAGKRKELAENLSRLVLGIAKTVLFKMKAGPRIPCTCPSYTQYESRADLSSTHDFAQDSKNPLSNAVFKKLMIFEKKLGVKNKKIRPQLLNRYINLLQS